MTGHDPDIEAAVAAALTLSSEQQETAMLALIIKMTPTMDADKLVRLVRAHLACLCEKDEHDKDGRLAALHMLLSLPGPMSLPSKDVLVFVRGFLNGAGGRNGKEGMQ